MRQRIAGLLVAVVPLVACTATPIRSPSIPPSGTPPSSVVGPAPSPLDAATPRPATTSVAIPITCGVPGATIDLRTCLAAVAVAIQGVTVDAVTSVSLGGPMPAGGWPPPSSLMVGATKIEVQVVPTLAYHARFESATGWTDIPLYVGDASDNSGWGTGPPPSDGRIWTVSGDLTAWSYPQLFSLEAFVYVFQVGCGGAGIAGGAKGGGTAILESIATDGSSADVGRLTCGPVETGDVASARLSLAAGNYRLRFQNVLHALGAQLMPIATER